MWPEKGKAGYIPAFNSRLANRPFPQESLTVNLIPPKPEVNLPKESLLGDGKASPLHVLQGSGYVERELLMSGWGGGDGVGRSGGWFITTKQRGRGRKVTKKRPGLQRFCPTGPNRIPDKEQLGLRRNTVRD